MLFNIFTVEKGRKGVAQHKIPLAQFVKKHYLCSRIDTTQSFFVP